MTTSPRPAVRRPRRLALGAVAAVTGVLLAACGGGGDEDADDRKKDRDSSAETEAAEPQFPPVAADYLVPEVDLTGLTGRTIEPGERGLVQLPWTEVRVSTFLELDSFVDEDGETVGPAEGEALRVLALDVVVDPDVSDVPPVGVFLEDGGARTQLTSDVTTLEPFLASLSDEARLVLAMDGHEVDVDLSTGTRVDDPVTEVYYRGTPRKQDLGKPLAFTTARSTHDGEPVEVPYRSTLDVVSLTPYLSAATTGDASRWAEPGTLFLVVDVHGPMATGPGCCPDWDVETTRQEWTATIDGTDYTSINTVEFTDEYSDQYRWAIFEVPSTVTDVTLSVAARTNATGLKDQNLAHGRQSVEVSFGG